MPQRNRRPKVRYRRPQDRPSRSPRLESRHRRARWRGRRLRPHPNRRPRYRRAWTRSRQLPESRPSARMRKHLPPPRRQNHLTTGLLRPGPPTRARPTNLAARSRETRRKSRRSEMQSQRGVSSHANSPIFRRLTRTTGHHRDRDNIEPKLPTSATRSLGPFLLAATLVDRPQHCRRPALAEDSPTRRRR